MKRALACVLKTCVIVTCFTVAAWSATIRSSSNYGFVPDFAPCTGGGSFGATTVTCLAAQTTGAYPGQPVFTFSVPSGSPVPISVNLMFPGGSLPGAFGLVQCGGSDTPATSPCTSAASLTDLGALTGTAANAQFTFLNFSSPVSVFFDVNAKITGVTVAGAAVPEPATGALMVLPAIALLVVRRKRRAHSPS